MSLKNNSLNQIIASVLIIFLSFSCKKDSSNYLTDGFCIEFEDGYYLMHTDIDYYDVSSHTIFLKGTSSFLKKYSHGSQFKVFANYQMVYVGQIYSPFSSFLPLKPFIYDYGFPQYSDFFIFMDKVPSIYNPDNPQPDPRSDDKIFEALQKYDQYRAGLKLEITSITRPSYGNVVLEFTLTNQDDQSYYILDPEKMGLGLFHYYTPGLILGNNLDHYSHSIITVVPNPPNSWSMSWFSLIEGGSSKNFTFNYENFYPIAEGEYVAFFTYPSLTSSLERSDLNQPNGRTWVGDIRVEKQIVIE